MQVFDRRVTDSAVGAPCVAPTKLGECGVVLALPEVVEVHPGVRQIGADFTGVRWSATTTAVGRLSDDNDSFYTVRFVPPLRRATDPRPRSVPP